MPNKKHHALFFRIKKMKMKKLFTVLCCILMMSATYSQSYSIDNLRVSGYSHNYNCGNDGGSADPEPNYRVRWKVTGGTYGAITVVRPGAPTQACDSYSANVALSPSTYNGSNNTLQFEIESWEDDDCGTANTFDDNCFFNDDDNHSFETKTLMLSSGITSVTFTLSNGYTITFNYDLTVLPISLSRFEGILTQKGIALRWQTVQESNSFEFEIEKSKNGRYFETIEIIDAAGDSKQPLDYEFIDTEILDLAYYRLKMVDLDGSYKYSKSISVANSKKHTLLFEKLYPNPTNGTLNVRLQSGDISTAIKMRITDIMGRTVQVQSLEVKNGSSLFQLDVSGLSPGQYLLTAINKDQLVSRRFVVE